MPGEHLYLPPRSESPTRVLATNGHAARTRRQARGYRARRDPRRANQTLQRRAALRPRWAAPARLTPHGATIRRIVRLRDPVPESARVARGRPGARTPRDHARKTSSSGPDHDGIVILNFNQAKPLLCGDEELGKRGQSGEQVNISEPGSPWVKRYSASCNTVPPRRGSTARCSASSPRGRSPSKAGPGITPTRFRDAQWSVPGVV
jgi:hypothetical protein